MKRLGMLLAVATVATVGMLAPSPASADIDACAGQGSATLQTGIGYPVVAPARTASFNFTFGLAGACVAKGNLSASGTVHGNCGLSAGVGVTQNGHEFSFTSTGTLLVLTGEVTGTVSAVPDPTHSGSCASGTAVRFLITGDALKTHACDDTGTAC